ncbi:hypothetical protein AX774_g5021 [Zancudomyces culisetae]|uniref:Uncharacterized protein n=1 Tax=Zancudomyces culisetae TaxID=1213189 RepID=A0A1R1PKL4_ZANCU|nr:hypothetical protein AX774_g5021 [Zancudomyces culisetae]|eukprot:OMH81518.1 hypothetical protein AX774_g5021 [Zancudomyces culisetae]
MPSNQSSIQPNSSGKQEKGKNKIKGLLSSAVTRVKSKFRGNKNKDTYKTNKQTIFIQRNECIEELESIYGDRPNEKNLAFGRNALDIQSQSSLDREFADLTVPEKNNGFKLELDDLYTKFPSLKAKDPDSIRRAKMLLHTQSLNESAFHLTKHDINKINRLNRRLSVSLKSGSTDYVENQRRIEAAKSRRRVSESQGVAVPDRSEVLEKIHTDFINSRFNNIGFESINSKSPIKKAVPGEKSKYMLEGNEEVASESTCAPNKPVVIEKEVEDKIVSKDSITDLANTVETGTDESMPEVEVREKIDNKRNELEKSRMNTIPIIERKPMSEKDGEFSYEEQKDGDDIDDSVETLKKELDGPGGGAEEEFIMVYSHEKVAEENDTIMEADEAHIRNETGVDEDKRDKQEEHAINVENDMVEQENDEKDEVQGVQQGSSESGSEGDLSNLIKEINTRISDSSKIKVRAASSNIIRYDSPTKSSSPKKRPGTSSNRVSRDSMKALASAFSNYRSAMNSLREQENTNISRMVYTPIIFHHNPSYRPPVEPKKSSYEALQEHDDVDSMLQVDSILVLSDHISKRSRPLGINNEQQLRKRRSSPGLSSIAPLRRVENDSTDRRIQPQSTEYYILPKGGSKKSPLSKPQHVKPFDTPPLSLFDKMLHRNLNSPYSVFGKTYFGLSSSGYTRPTH